MKPSFVPETSRLQPEDDFWVPGAGVAELPQLRGLRLGAWKGPRGAAEPRLLRIRAAG